MRPIATIDAETDPFRRGRFVAPFIWGFYDNGFLDPDKPFRYFTSTEDLVEFLQDKEFVVYAHNGGKFDYHFLLKHVETFDPVMIIDGRISKFHIGICEFRDSFNILPVPLAAYKKTKIDYGIMEKEERNKPDNWQTIVSYLFDDCKDLWDLVNAFIDRFGFNLTQAGASMKQWQKISGTKAPRSTEEFYEQFRPYYYGGRVQCFKTGLFRRPFKSADINSAYPRAMVEKHPYGLSYELWKGKSAQNILEELEDYEIGASFFKVHGEVNGCFPYRDIDGSLSFPVGDIEQDFCVTGWELLAALETKTISNFEILEARVFDELVSFEDYVYKFYEEKKQADAIGDLITRLFAKLFMNSLYGKYAANPAEYHEYIVLDKDFVGLLDPKNRDTWVEVEGKDYRFAGMFGPNILAQADLESEQRRYYNVATAASITGWVRAYLWRYICQAKEVMYCDTDMIAAEEVNVPLGSELGQWTIEGNYTVGAIGGRKMYAFKYAPGTGPKGKKWKVASKGVKFGPRQVVAVAQGKKITYEPEIPTYSVKKPPTFVPRNITMLEKDKAVLTYQEKQSKV